MKADCPPPRTFPQGENAWQRLLYLNPDPEGNPARETVELMNKETETVQAETPEGADIVRPYSTRRWDELARMILESPLVIWGGWVLAHFQRFSELVGWGNPALR